MEGRCLEERALLRRKQLGLILDEHMVTCFETKFDMNTDLEERLKEFIESEGKSCSFDPEAIVVHGSWFMIKGSWL